MNKDKCLIIKDKKFLFWRWKSKNYDHDWGYIKHDLRKCQKCGAEQLLWGLSTDEYKHEDWRYIYKYVK